MQIGTLRPQSGRDLLRVLELEFEARISGAQVMVLPLREDGYNTMTSASAANAPEEGNRVFVCLEG